MEKYFKIFLNEVQEIKKIEYTSDNQKNYFEFVRSQYSKGFKQVIITSKVMLEILSNYFYKNYRINEIEFGEEDEELDDEIKKILTKIDKDRGCFNQLLKKLECIGQESSIDIVKIKMTNLNKENDIYFSFTLRVNGILSINSVSEEENNLLKIIRKNI
ncbi:MAG: hypothetical protein ACRC0F_07390 [Cetobacterium sp.]